MLHVNSQPTAGQTRSTATVLQLNGRFDVHQASHFQQWLDTQFEESQAEISVDLSKVIFLDFAALNLLLAAKARCEAAGGRLRLHGIRQPVRIIFELTGHGENW